MTQCSPWTFIYNIYYICIQTSERACTYIGIILFLIHAFTDLWGNIIPFFFLSLAFRRFVCPPRVNRLFRTRILFLAAKHLTISIRSLPYVRGSQCVTIAENAHVTDTAARWRREIRTINRVRRLYLRIYIYM